MRSILPLAALAAAVLAAPAAAQQQHQQPVVHAVARLDVADPSAIAYARAPRIVGAYRIHARELGLPAQVTLRDSAGALTAAFRAPGSRRMEPMTVTVMGTDLVLQGQTSRGLLTMVLARQNDADASARVQGHWTLADRQGTLRGKVKG